MRDLAELFKALSDETRLWILALILVRGETCVCDVEGVFDITQSKASRHLRYLRNAGLLMDRRDGTWVHYSVPADLDAEREALLETVRSLAGPGRLKELKLRLKAWEKQKAGQGACRLG